MAKHLLPASGIRHGRAARTGWDASPYRWIPFDRCFALPAVANRQSVCAPLVLQLPAATRVEHRDAARMCLMVEVRDCATRTRTSMSGRSPQDAAEAGACRKNGSAKPFASRWIARVSWNGLQELALRTPERKNPRMGIRGRSRVSEIGATDLRREDQSWCVSRFCRSPGLP